MGRVQGNGHSTQPHIEPVHGTATVVSREHSFAEGRVMSSTGYQGRQVKAHGLHDVAMKFLGEVTLQKQPGDFAGRGGVGSQRRLDLFRETARRLIREKSTLRRIGVALLRGKQRGAADDPDAVARKPPKGVFGVVGLPRRTELLEQLSQVAVHVAERNVGQVTARPAAACVEQQRLVRGTRVSASPESESVGRFTSGFTVQVCRPVTGSVAAGLFCFPGWSTTLSTSKCVGKPGLFRRFR